MKRLAREAERTIPRLKGQSFTSRELFDRDRDPIRQQHADLEKRLRAASKPVRDEYVRCTLVIERLMAVLPPEAKVESATLHPAMDGTSLSREEIISLSALLSHPANGWQVSPWTDSENIGGQDKIIFRHDPRRR